LRKLNLGIEQPKEYYDKLMYKYPAAEIKYQKLYDSVLKFTPTDKNVRILDVGCGTGGLINTLKNNGYTNIIGLDFSDYCVNYCKKRFPNVNFFQIDLKDSSSKKFIQDFPVVIMLEVLEHLKDDISVIKKIKSDSLVIFSLPNYDSKGHVRFFKNIDEIKNRFEPVLVIEKFLEIPLKTNTKIFLIKSRRR
jgi:2-polyprenyl-3-methyl-5-hydroxy-6-metoxy-1,4-benzoquinol methylase